LAALLIVSFYAGAFAGFESFFEDLLVSAKPVNPDIAVVAIDNESLAKIGQWPWPREVFGKAFDSLNANPPKAVALDVVFADASRLGEKDDYALRNSLAKLRYPLIFPVEASGLNLRGSVPPSADNLILPGSSFTAYPQISLGHVNLILDADGVARRFPPLITYAEKSFKGLSYEALKRSGLNIPGGDNLYGPEKIVYSAPSGSIRRIPFYRLLEPDPPNLSGKLVLMGVTAPDLHDEKPTPFGRGTEMPGVEIQANIVNMLLSGFRLNPLGRIPTAAWILIAALLPALFFSFYRKPLLPLALSVFVGIMGFAAEIFLFQKGLAVNLVHTNMAWILSAGSLLGYRYFKEEKDKRELQAAFSKYVSGDVLQEILKNPSKIALGGEEREITVLFSDIRGFTALSEKTTPKELVRILNKYFTAMTNEILKNHGVLDKYIGDAIMAFWGAPLPDENQADNAFLAARGMAERLKEVNRELEEKGDPTIAIGIGIYTGPAVVGNMGSEERFDYTAMGDTVNVASRLEGLNKEHGTTLIIGESTKEKIKAATDAKFLGEVQVKGRAVPVKIYTVNIP
jgi:adenylate cyclase